MTSAHTRTVDPIAVASADAAVQQVLLLMSACGWKVIVVDSPPGARKSTLVVTIADVRTGEHGEQVPIVTQSNAQSDDLVRALRTRFAGSGRLIGRLHNSTDYTVPDDLTGDPSLRFSTDVARLSDCAVIVAPAKKWAGVPASRYSWPFGIIDEAYQVSSRDLLDCADLFQALVAVGDPGQLSPFTTGDEALVRGVPVNPLVSAAHTLLASHPDAHIVALPVSWRLTPAAADLVSPAFYTTPFTAGTRTNARRMSLPRLGSADSVDAALGHAATTGWALLELPEAHMPTTDPRAVDTIASLVTRTLAAAGSCRDESGRIYPLDGGTIAVGVAHRAQRDAVRARLAAALRAQGIAPETVVVDTANRLQGRQYELVIAWHPMSGRRHATGFHVDAGRLCVLMSRHRQACVLVTRGGLREQLESFPQPAPLWLGEHQPAVDGWEANLTVLERLAPHRIAA